MAEFWLGSYAQCSTVAVHSGSTSALVSTGMGDHSRVRVMFAPSLYLTNTQVNSTQPFAFSIATAEEWNSLPPSL